MRQFLETNHGFAGPQCRQERINQALLPPHAVYVAAPSSLSHTWRDPYMRNRTASSNLSVPIIRNVQQARLRRPFLDGLAAIAATQQRSWGCFTLAVARRTRRTAVMPHVWFCQIKSCWGSNQELQQQTTVIKSERERWRINSRLRNICYTHTHTDTRNEVYDDSQTDVCPVGFLDSLDFSRGRARRRLLIGRTLSLPDIVI